MIKIGGLIGGGAVVLIMFATAIIGIFLVQKQGRETIDRLRYHVENRRLPVFEMFEGLCLFLAGLLLIVPGFFTDIVALLLLVPVMRLRMFNQIRPWAKQGQDDMFNDADNVQFSYEEYHERRRYTPPPVIEGEYKDVTKDTNDDSRKDKK